MNTTFMRNVPFIFLLLLLPVIVFLAETGIKLSSRAKDEPASIYVDAQTVTGPLPFTWKALAQGGEEKGVQMLANVIPLISDLQPRYIRIDHIYDFYDVVSRESDNSLRFSWTELDKTICDITASGARPFLSLGYMPEVLSSDGTLIGAPRDWNEWQTLVQATIEHYSGNENVICQNQNPELLNEIYYEVWNEPDLESFGNWNIHGGEKDYKKLYFYSSEGAKNAQNVRKFYFGGPATTRAYQNWIQILTRYAQTFNMRLDFISWHHYSTKTDDFSADLSRVDQWLSGKEYEFARTLPRVISEWGFDSCTNPLSETTIAAAHSVATIRHLIDQDLEMAFAFEIKDGLTPRWGMINYAGDPKPRYYGLKLLNVLGSRRLLMKGEGSWVQGLASIGSDVISIVLVNYDELNQHSEVVPITISGLIPNTTYQYVQSSINGENTTSTMPSSSTGIISRLLPMAPNSAYALQLKPL